eukprot:jgi/Bigna1/128327/aug1.6_g3035
MARSFVSSVLCLGGALVSSIPVMSIKPSLSLMGIRRLSSFGRVFHRSNLGKMTDQNMSHRNCVGRKIRRFSGKAVDQKEGDEMDEELESGEEDHNLGEDLEKRMQMLNEELKDMGIPHEIVEEGAEMGNTPLEFINSIREAEGLPEGAIVLVSTEGIDQQKRGDLELQKLVDETKNDATSLLQAADLNDVELSITLSDDPSIQRYNKEYRDVDKPTDVLSFPMDDNFVLGDLIISIDTANKQALDHSHELRDEVKLMQMYHFRSLKLNFQIRILLVHGLLHLIGYDHETSKEDWEEMASAERRLMRRLDWRGKGLIHLAEED